MPGQTDGRSGKFGATTAPRRNRGIIVAGLLLCVGGAVLVAYLLGVLDRVGFLS